MICFALFLLIIITAFTWITSCTHTADITGVPDVCFDRDVLPIFQNNCAISGCHDGRGESDLMLTNYADISRSVVPGNPGASRIYKTITATYENKMPPNQPLSLENRTIIRFWIEQGARPTTCQ